LVQRVPVKDKAKRSWRKVTEHVASFDFDRDFALAIYGMKMRHTMFAVEHADHDSRKREISGKESFQRLERSGAARCWPPLTGTLLVSLLRQHLHQNSEFVAFFWGGHSAAPSHGQSTLNRHR